MSMDFDLNADQAALESGIRSLTERYRGLPTPHEAGHFLSGEAIARELREAGYYDVARQEGMGPLESVLLVEAVAALPYAVEAAGSVLIAPLVSRDALPGPVAVCSDAGAAIRFLAEGGTLLVDAGHEVRIVDLAGVVPEPVDTPFAYPYARLPAAKHKGELFDLDPRKLRQYWQLGLAAEITGAMQAALDLTLEYVKQRKQFGRAIGSFQAVQHRLAESAMQVHSARMLTRAAAMSGSPLDCAMAASYAQEASMQVVYNTHQFHGAMGLTLEYPLHYWTQRLRALQGEAGGASAIAQGAAGLL
jgi:hypothetical protein